MMKSGSHVVFQPSQLLMQSINALYSGINCTAPPAKPGAGTIDWNGSVSYGSRAVYTCGPYGNFLQPSSGALHVEEVAVCAWNKSWVPPSLPTCAATHCQTIPLPPPATGLLYRPDAKNNMTLKSGGSATQSWAGNNCLASRQRLNDNVIELQGQDIIRKKC